MTVNGKKNSGKVFSVESRERQIEQLNSEFETLFSSSKTENGAANTEAIEFLRQHLQRTFIWRILKWCFVILIISTAVYYIPILNWNTSAIGRLLLINLVKPVWNWEQLTNAQCLIDLPVRDGLTDLQPSSSEVFEGDCVVCETLGDFTCSYNFIG